MRHATLRCSPAVCDPQGEAPAKMRSPAVLGTPPSAAHRQLAIRRARPRGMAKNQPSASSYGPSYVWLRFAGSPGERERANAVRPHCQVRYEGSHLRRAAE